MRKSVKLRLLAGLASATALSACAAGVAQSAPDSTSIAPNQPDGDWRTINRDLAATRFSPLDEINKSNVAQLAEAWSYPLRGFNTAVPLVIGRTMYATAGNRVIALDADTGQEVWVHEEPRPANAPPGPGGVSGRGVG